MKLRRTLALSKEQDQDLRYWMGEISFSSFVDRLLSRGLREALHLEGLEVEHVKGGGASRIYLEGGVTRSVAHEIRGEVVLVRHVYNPSQCGGCGGLKESFGGRP